MTWHAYEWTDNLCPANVRQWHAPCYDMGDVSGTMESTCVAGSQEARLTRVAIGGAPGEWLETARWIDRDVQAGETVGDLWCGGLACGNGAA